LTWRVMSIGNRPVVPESLVFQRLAVQPNQNTYITRFTYGERWLRAWARRTPKRNASASLPSSAVSIAALAQGAAGDDGPGYRGGPATVLWRLVHHIDTNVTGMNLSFDKSIYVAVPRQPDHPRLEDKYRVRRPAPAPVRLQGRTAAVVTVINSTLVLDTFTAYGQAALTFQNGSRVTTTGRFLAQNSAIFAYDTQFSNVCPQAAVADDQRGEDAVFVARRPRQLRAHQRDRHQQGQQCGQGTPGPTAPRAA